MIMELLSDDNCDHANELPLPSSYEAVVNYTSNFKAISPEHDVECQDLD